ncbi:hypothetical protein QWY84_18125 [Aquisalimonas lutea]|uniref:hypothetical protein n=1 Tax=Aquisalimonas lutea TaxID=1327750 RepID=UPI0025B4022B|nr:hypothetical protein [Aquisalimonas lutea]MDN3519529.1 hypothetical protein [Aquisalimonas lutea]
MQDIHPFVTARAWLLRQCRPVAGTEWVPVTATPGRRLAMTALARDAMPAVPVATLDGAAVRAEETLGASPYNPIPGCALGTVRPGDPLPAGADAVAPWDAVVNEGAVLMVVAEMDAGHGVCDAARLLRPGQPVTGPDRRLSGPGAAMLLSLGFDQVPVRRAPRVRILHAEPQGGTRAIDVLLSAALRPDGALVETTASHPGPVSDGELVEAAAEADLVVLVAGPGERSSRTAAAAVARIGHLEAHAIGIRPGVFAALGHVGDTPVVIVPGEPVSAHVIGELLAGPAVRALSGDGPELPHARVEAPLTRKVTSTLGLVECIRVRMEGEGLAPRRVSTDLDLPALAATDGFILIDADSEGYPADTAVTAYLDRAGGGI